MGHERSWASDIDLIVVLDDGCGDEEIAEARSRLRALNPSMRPRGLLGHLFSSIEQATGMFSGPFVCRESDLHIGDFKSIFGTSALMTELLAPTGLVLGGATTTFKCIYGRAPEMSIPRRRSLHVLKSLIMCFLLSIGGIILCPIAVEGLKYVLEAMKWAIYATYYYARGEIRPLQEIASVLATRGPFPWKTLAKELLRLRKELKRAGLALLLAPLGVLMLHIKAIGRPESLYKSE